MVSRKLNIAGQLITVPWRVMQEESTLEQLKQSILTACYGHHNPDDVRRHRRSKGQGQGFRYRNLNLHSWFYRHTLEWRMPDGTINAPTIINWGVLLAGLMDTASCLTEKEIVGMIKETVQPTRDVNRTLIGSMTILERLASTEPVRHWVRERIALCTATGAPAPLSSEWLVFP